VLALVAVTILAGGLTAGTKAGLVYETFPLMDGRFVPDGYFALSPWWINPFENVTAVQLDHRLLAETTFVAILATWVAARRVATDGRLALALHGLVGAVLLQVTLGISTLLAGVPVWLAALHQASAALLLTMSLLAVYFSRA
jgi:cytochrome c oxidase assembly protein subunit 15